MVAGVPSMARVLFETQIIAGMLLSSATSIGTSASTTISGSVPVRLNTRLMIGNESVINNDSFMFL